MKAKQAANAIISRNIFFVFSFGRKIKIGDSSLWCWIVCFYGFLQQHRFLAHSQFYAKHPLCEYSPTFSYPQGLFRGRGKRLFQGLFHFNPFSSFASLSVANRYDDTRPIDIQYSIIAQKLFNITVKEH